MARSLRQPPLDLGGRRRDYAVMLAAALTVWILFSLWLIAPLLRLPPTLGRVAGTLLWAELTALLVYSYGIERCDDATCAPIARAARIAASTDVPILTATVIAIAGVQLARGARAGGA